MKIHLDLAAVRRTKSCEYAIRFLFGGLITAITGIIAKKLGPQVGGLFLAFPAIFPAATTLLEKNEKRKKQRKGLHGARRGRLAAGVDAAGTAMGTVGLLAFALLVWKWLPDHSSWTVLGAATLAWIVVASSVWASIEAVRNRQRSHRCREFARGTARRP